VEDNKELCRIELAPETEQSHPNNSDGNTIPAAVNNNSTINYNTTENYNINNGTVNSATINKEPSDIITIEESPEPGTRANNGPSLLIVIAPETETTDGEGYIKKRSVDDRLPTERTTSTDTDIHGLTAGESVIRAPKNDISQKRARQNQARSSGTFDQHYEPGTTTDAQPRKYARSANDKRAPTGQQLMITDGPSPHDGVGTDNNGSRGQKARRSWPSVTRVLTNGNDEKNVSGHHSAVTNANTHDPDHVENNNVSLKNGVENGQTGKSDCDHDILSAGSSNSGTVMKGYVEDGTLNNGNMVQYNVNNGTINKGEISGSNADNGIISVGTVNNGPVNYGTSDTYANNGKQVAMNSFDVQQYLSNIDKMYSTILERLG